MGLNNPFYKPKFGEMKPEDKTELKKLLDNTIKFTNSRQRLIVILWCFFNPKRVERFVYLLKQGMSWKYAMKTSKNN